MAEKTTEQLVQELDVLCHELPKRLHGSEEHDSLRKYALEVAQKTMRELQTPIEFSRAQIWAVS